MRSGEVPLEPFAIAYVEASRFVSRLLMMNRRSTRRENGSRARPPVTSTFLLQKEGRVTLTLYSIADATSASFAMLLFFNILETKRPTHEALAVAK